MTCHAGPRLRVKVARGSTVPRLPVEREGRAIVNVGLWTAQVLLALVFGVSAAVKGSQPQRRVVELGMTGVVNVSVPVMRFTAVCEALGVVGLFAPWLTGVFPVLTPLAAMGLAVIMVCATTIHLRLGEVKTAVGTVVLLGLCLFVAWGRWPQ